MRWQVILILMLLMLPTVTAVNTITNSTYINDFLRDSTGNPNVTGDYTSAFTNFSIQPPRNETWTIERVIVFIEDATINRLDYYGGGGSALTNGLVFFIEKNGTQIPLTPEAIKTNGDWGRYNYDAEIKDEAAGLDYFYARWTFGRSGAPLRLVGENNDKLFMVARDNFNFLSEHTFAVQGQKIPDEVDGLTMLAIMLAIMGSACIILWAFKDLREDFFFFKGIGYIATFWFVVSALNVALAIDSLTTQTISSSIEAHYMGFTYFSLGITMLIGVGYLVYFLQIMIQKMKESTGGRKR